MESNRILAREASDLLILIFQKLPDESKDLISTAINGIRLLVRGKVPKSDKKGIPWLEEISSIMLADAIKNLSSDDLEMLALKLLDVSGEMLDALELEKNGGGERGLSNISQ